MGRIRKQKDTLTHTIITIVPVTPDQSSPFTAKQESSSSSSSLSTLKELFTSILAVIYQQISAKYRDNVTIGSCGNVRSIYISQWNEQIIKASDNKDNRQQFR